VTLTEPGQSPEQSAQRSPQQSAQRALVIAHEPDGPGGVLEARLNERGFATTTHLVTEDYDAPNDAAPFPAIDEFDLIAVMGSIRSLTKKEEIDSWVYDELELIRIAHESDKPVIGVCFGGQLISDALGGSVEEAPVTEIGWYEINPAAGQDNPVGAGPWMEWHHDRFTAPPEATIIAETDDAIQLFTMGRTAALQFHPEVDIAHIKGWLDQADEEYLSTYNQTAAGLLADMERHDERNQQQCRDLVDWFLDTVAFPDEA